MSFSHGMRTVSVLVGRDDERMLNTAATQVLVEDRHRELRRAAARQRTVRTLPLGPGARAWVGWMLVRTGWRLAAAGRRTNVTICGRTML
jgi:hypothetical protein